MRYFELIDNPLDRPVGRRGMDFSPARRDRGVRLRYLGLAAILLIAFYLRASTLSFGLPSLNDQDELVFQMGAVRLLTTPTLNPKWFGHPGTTTIYVLALVDIGTYLFGLMMGWWQNANGFVDAFFANPTLVILPGRAIILAFGLATIALTYRLGARLSSPVAGLVAALILAVSPLHVAYSQIIRTDIMGTAFMLLALLQALRAARGEGGLSAYIKSGVWAGVSIATKWPFALTLLAPIGAALLSHRMNGSGGRLLIKRVLVSIGCAALTLIVISPFLILDWQTVVANLAIEGRPIHLGATGGSFWWNMQWYLTQPLPDALALVGLLAAGAGLVLMATNREARYVLVPLALAFFVLLCSQKLVWPRWCIPLLPILAIAIGTAMARLASASAGLHRAWVGPALAGAAIIAITLPLAQSSLSQGRERMNDTRQQASRWLMANVPPGHTVLLEHFGFDLLQAPYSLRWPIGDAGCIDPRSLIRNKANLQQIERMRGHRSNVDYGTVAPDKLKSCRTEYAIITQYDRYAAERERFSQQYAQYSALIKSAQTLAIFRPEPGVSGGWVVRVLKISPDGPARTTVATKR